MYPDGATICMQYLDGCASYYTAHLGAQKSKLQINNNSTVALLILKKNTLTTGSKLRNMGGTLGQLQGRRSPHQTVKSQRSATADN
jgi:hypothetical protein